MKPQVRVFYPGQKDCMVEAPSSVVDHYLDARKHWNLPFCEPVGDFQIEVDNCRAIQQKLISGRSYPPYETPDKWASW